MRVDLRPAIREAVYSSMKRNGIAPSEENYVNLLHNMLSKLSNGENTLYVAIVAEITNADSEG